MCSLLAKLMGNAESSSNRKPPGNIEKINSSLHKLYCPSDGTPEIDIVFFHGLQLRTYKDAYWTTWCAESIVPQLWPITLLSKEYPRARIMSVSYDSCARVTTTGGTNDLFNIGEKLVADLVFDTDGGAVGVNRPLILVGHSFGGFVIKRLILHAEQKKNQLYKVNEKQSVHYDSLASFLNNLRGIVYYSTPHEGSQLANYAAELPGSSDVLKVLTVGNKETARLNDAFRVWRQNHSKPAFTFYENRPTVYGKVFNAVVVAEASARADSDSYYGVDADHIKICKPTEKTDSEYKQFSLFIAEHVPSLTIGNARENLP